MGLSIPIFVTVIPSPGNPNPFSLSKNRQIPVPILTRQDPLRDILKKTYFSKLSYGYSSPACPELKPTTGKSLDPA